MLDLDSSSKAMQSIEHFFSHSPPGSPGSPCALPKILRRKGPVKRPGVNSKRPPPLATHSLNTLGALEETCFDSPTSTLAADISENFHIDSSKLPFRLPNRGTVLSKMDSIQTARPPFHNSNNDISARSSRTTSNASISSVCSLSSFSSVDSEGSIQHIAAPSLPLLQPQQPVRKTLRRSQTTAASNRGVKSLFGSVTFNDKFGFKHDGHDNDEQNILDRFCIPSPIAEKTLMVDDNEELDLHKREIGSPIQKKPVRAKVRRIHSMFYSKKEITDTTNMFGNLMHSSSPDLEKIHDGNKNAADEDDENCLPGSMLKKSKIETFNVKNDFIPRITVETLCKILDGCYSEFFDSVTVVDCRFEYEYKGGHIDGALNVSSQRELEEKFLDKHSKDSQLHSCKKKLIVFHCEFSSYRGPLMASHLRTCDRNINQDNYPHLDYPDILILEGGYKTFFDSQSHRCFPQKYVEMNDNNHKILREKELTRFKRDLKKASSFNNLSFAASVNTSTSSFTTTSTASSSFMTSTKHLHRRTMTSGTINFSRKPSLKCQFSDFTNLKTANESDDDNRPPAALNFAFKFPKPLDPPSLATAEPLFMNSKVALPSQAHSDTPTIKNKLSRSLTFNM